MPYKRILTVQDISCVGQCSMTVALPILSACAIETCILPTAVLSTHTGGFSRPSVHHLGASLDEIWKHWQREGITFDSIYTGYLGSVDAVEAVLNLSDALLAQGGELIVDPAMADHGRLYSGLSEAYAEKMKELSAKADILLPNITEAAMLSGLPYREPDREYIDSLLEGLCCRNVVLTGVGYELNEIGVEIRDGDVRRYYAHPKVGKNFHGTGDIFASCFTGARVQGRTLYEASRIAADFTCKAIENTWRAPAHGYGVKFETVLAELSALFHE